MKKLLLVLSVLILNGAVLSARNATNKGVIAEITFNQAANDATQLEGATGLKTNKMVFSPSDIVIKRYCASKVLATLTFQPGSRSLLLGPTWSTSNVNSPVEYATITLPAKSELKGAITLSTQIIVANKSWMDMDCNLIIQYSTSDDPTWRDIANGGKVALDAFGLTSANTMPVNAKAVLDKAIPEGGSISFRLFVDKVIPGPKNSNIGIYQSLKFIQSAK